MSLLVDQAFLVRPLSLLSTHKSSILLVEKQPQNRVFPLLFPVKLDEQQHDQQDNDLDKHHTTTIVPERKKEEYEACFSRHNYLCPKDKQTESVNYPLSASAPPTISKISLVIAA